MKIYTRTGDKGTTALIGGARVPKYDLRIESYGTVDELNAYIGLLMAQEIARPAQSLLKKIQDTLFIMGSSLASDPVKPVKNIPALNEEDIQLLETTIDALTAELPELRHFILPGGNNPVAFCHIARCICRRAERHAVHLASSSPVDPLVIIYLNRLSDYLFVLARKLSLDAGLEENKWIPVI